MSFCIGVSGGRELSGKVGAYEFEQYHILEAVPG